MAPESRGPVRLAIVDDNPFMRAPDGRIRPRAATFHRFAEAVVRAGPFGRARYVIPVRQPGLHDAPEARPAVDEDLLEVVPSEPFADAADYLKRLPLMWASNLPRLLRAVRGEHLVWIKVPGSNGPLAAYCCAALGVPRFSYIVGSVREVVGASERVGARRIAATFAATLHDASTRAMAATSPHIRLGPELFTSAVESDELEVAAAIRSARAADRSSEDPVRLVWSGRVAPEKGLQQLVEALTLLLAQGRRVELDILGDGPQRQQLERLTRSLGVAGSVRWRGHIADRAAYLNALGEGDLFVLPSRTEGVPKALIEAMGLGLPAVATAVGGVPEIARDGERLRLVPPGASVMLASAIADLLDAPGDMSDLAARGAGWARDHTAEAQAVRLLDWMRETFPALPWPLSGVRP